MTCKGGFHEGQTAVWKDYDVERIVALLYFERQGGFWVARDRYGVKVYPDTSALTPIGGHHA